MTRARQHRTLGAVILAFGLGACTAGDPEPIEATASELNGTIKWGNFPDGGCSDPAQQTRFKSNMTSAMTNDVLPWVVPNDSNHQGKMLECLKNGIQSGENYNPDVNSKGHEDVTNPETIMARMALKNPTRIGCQYSGGCNSGAFTSGAEDVTCNEHYGDTGVVLADLAGILGHEVAHRFWDHPFAEDDPNDLERKSSVNEQVSGCIISLAAGNNPGVPYGASRSAFVGEATLAQVGLEAGTPALPTYCPGNQFITGIYGNADSHVNRLGGICTAIDGTQTTNLGAVGTATGAAFSDSCPSGQIAVGAWGRMVAVADNLGTLPTTPIDAIGSVCDTVAHVKAGSTNARTDDTIHGGSGGGAWRRLCPPKQALKGLRLRGGPSVNRVELVCQDVTQASPIRQTLRSQAGGSGAFSYFENCQTRAVVTGLAIKVGDTNNIVRLGAACQGVVAEAQDPAAFDLSSLSSQKHAMVSHGSYFPDNPSNDFFDYYSDPTFAIVGLNVYTQGTSVSGIQPQYASVPGWSSLSNAQVTPGTLRGGATGTLTTVTCPAREFLVGWLLNVDDITTTPHEASIHAIQPVCRRFGPSASGNPRGYTRSDGVDVIVVRSPGSHVMEIVALVATDLTHEANASVSVLGDPWGYKRFDNTNAVVYRGSDNDIHELSKGGSPWSDGDLNIVSHASGVPAQGNPIGYVRSDNKNAVIYRGSDNHLHEFGLAVGGAWEHNDLTSVSGLHSSLAGDPMGYVRTDGLTTVVYRATDGHIHELGLTNGGSPPWVDNDLFVASGETVNAAFDPWGYQHDANKNAVVYVGTDGKLHQLLLTIGTNPPWTHGTLPATQPAGTPSGYVRWDGKAAVVYRSVTTPSTIRETLLDGTWIDASLDSVDHPSAGASGSPIGRRATNNMDSVVYLGTDSGVYEQRLGLTVTWNFTTY